MDSEVRKLERRYRASGAVEDGVPWLVARLRTGDLSSERLEVAALCGDEAAPLARPRPADELLSEAYLRSFVAEMSWTLVDVTLRRWFAAGLRAQAVEDPSGPRYDPVAVLTWLERERLPQLAKMTILFVERQHPVAALRLVWAAMRESRKESPRRGWTAFLEAAGTWLDDPTLEPADLPGLREAPGAEARLLLRAIEGRDATALGVYGSLAKRLGVKQAAARFLAARREVASWALTEPRASARLPYDIRTETDVVRTGSDHPLAYDYHDTECRWSHSLVDRRTGRVVRRWSSSSPYAFEFSSDGTELVVRDDDRIVERHRLPP